jgi:hypothetical protein
LRARQQAEHSTTELLAVFPDDRRQTEEFLRSAGLQVPAVSDVALWQLHVSRTPTILLVDRDGKVLDYWIGSMPAARESEVAKALFTLQ